VPGAAHPNTSPQQQQQQRRQQRQQQNSELLVSDLSPFVVSEGQHVQVQHAPVVHGEIGLRKQV